MLVAFLPLLFCYIAPGLMGAIGLWHLANPLNLWKLARLQSQTEGLATADEPTPAALRVIRARGVFLLIIALVWAIFSQSFFSDWQERRAEHQRITPHEWPG